MHDGNAFDCVTILVLAVNETESLRKTVCSLEDTLRPEDVRKILICFPPWVTAGCEAVINDLSARRFPIPVAPEKQISAKNAESLLHIFRKEKDATHIMLWASDGEVAPEKAALLVGAAQENPRAFVKFSRMMKGGSQPAGKNLFLKVRDRMFCLLARARLRAAVTDALFFGHVLFPTAPFEEYCVTEEGMGLFLEILNVFARQGAGFIELPVQAQLRAEAKSNIKLRQKFEILFHLLRLGKQKKTREGTQ